MKINQNVGKYTIPMDPMGFKKQNWLVVSTRLKNISRIGSFPQVGMKIKSLWNHPQWV